MVDAVLALPEGTRLMVLRRWCATARASSRAVPADMQTQGFVRFRVDGTA